MATLAELAESLTSSQTAALLQKVIDTQLVDVFRKEDPIKGALATKMWASAVYYWNTRNRLPYAQPVVEAPPTSGAGSVGATQSNYLQNSVPIAHYQVQGDLSKFNIKVATASITNLLEEEMSASTQAMSWLQTMLHLYGSASATKTSLRPQWDGFDRQISQSSANRSAPNAGVGTGLTLLDLDNAIDAVRTKIAAPLPGQDFAFIVSEPMISKMGRLVGSQRQVLQNVVIKPERIDGTSGSVSTADPGIEVPSYRGIPILGTSFLTPSGAMSVVTAAASGTGGTMAAAARYYAVEAITQYGPTYAAAANVTPSASNTVSLTFATPSAQDIFGNQQPILQYRVYEGPNANSMTLYGVVAANDAGDTAVTSIQDTGSEIIANPGANQVVGLFAGASADAGDGVNVAPPTSAPSAGYDESIFLISRKSDFVCVPTVTEVASEILANVNARSVQYALTGDCALAMRAPAFGFKLQRVLTV
ncbi:MAG: hypothetical protein ACRDFS_02400 [Chloroflexota bacterium]